MMVSIPMGILLGSIIMILSVLIGIYATLTLFSCSQRERLS
jgi:hypothetical protein